MIRHTTLGAKRSSRRLSRTAVGGIFLFAPFFCCFTGQAVLNGAEPSLPEAAVILDKYIKVTGGRTAYEKIHNRVSKGHHEFVGMGLEGTQTNYQARPNGSQTACGRRNLPHGWNPEDCRI